MEEIKSPSLLHFFKNASVAIKIRLAVIGALAVAVLITSLLMITEIWKANSRFRPFPSKPLSGERAVAHAPVSSVVSYELRGISLSLSDRTGRRSGYAQFNLVLELPSPEAKRWCELNRAQIVHLLLEQGSRFSLEDFENPRGYELFKKELVDAFREKFKEHAPRTVLFKDISMH